MRAAALFLLPLLGLLAGCGERAAPAPPHGSLAPDVPAALAAHHADHQPVVALLVEEDDTQALDMAHWLTEVIAAGEAPAAHWVIVRRDDPRSAQVVPVLHTSALVRLAPAAGNQVSVWPLPRTHDALSATLAQAAHAPPPPAPKATPEPAALQALRDALHRIGDPGRRPPADVADARHRLTEGVSRLALSPPALALLAYGVSIMGDAALHHAFLDRLQRELPHAHDAIEAALDLADDLVDAGDLAGAEAAYARIATLDADAPMLAQAARDQRALLHPDASATRRACEDRTAGDVVVLAGDVPAALQAIAHWTPTSFYPVLIEDRTSARFLEAYHPHTVLRLPARGGTVDAQALLATVLASWGGLETGIDDRPGSPVPAVDAARLDARLHALGLPPDGLVAIDPASPAAIGGIALAAARFQAVRLLAPPSHAGHPAQLHDILSYDEAHAWAEQVEALLDAAIPPTDGWRFLTLAGAYPYRWEGADVYGTINAVDDLLGRDRWEGRRAVCGRLQEDAARALYQAMGSLFLTIDQALLLDGYDQNPTSSFGPFRLAPLAAALEGRWHCELQQPDAVATMRARTAPYSHVDALIINSAGGPDWWSIPGDGSSDDLPLGQAYVCEMLHSFSAADPWDADTIAGRALWGGAYWFYGSVQEPLVDAWQATSYRASRLRLGVPWAQLARTHAGEFGARPWRLYLIGDPRLAIRLQPLRRDAVPVALAGATPVTLVVGPPRDALVQARLLGHTKALRAAVAAIDGPTCDADTLALALESCLQLDDLARACALWQAAPAASRTTSDCQRLVRIAALTRTDRARAADQWDGFLAGAALLLDAGAPPTIVTRLTEAGIALATTPARQQAWTAWLHHQGDLHPTLAPLLTDWATRSELEARLALPRWRAQDFTVGLTDLLTLARGGRWDDHLAGWIDMAGLRWSAGSGQGPDLVLRRLERVTPPCPALTQALETVHAHAVYPRDWLILGPFAEEGAPTAPTTGAAVTPSTSAAVVAPVHGTVESQAALERHPGHLDRAVAVTDADGALRHWRRPFTPRDAGIVDLAALLTPHEHVHAYAAIHVVATKDTDGFLQIGSDDGVVVWLDGQELERVVGERSLTPDGDHLRVHLRAGSHLLLLRIDQERGTWAFCARWTKDEAAKEPLPGIWMGQGGGPTGAPTVVP